MILHADCEGGGGGEMVGISGRKEEMIGKEEEMALSCAEVSKIQVNC